MKTLFLFAFSFLFFACSSSHKLIGTDYVDLSARSALITTTSFPTEIADSLGWGDLSSGTLTNVNEEFRFVISAKYEPFQLYRIHKGKNIEGELILFWSKRNTVNVSNPQSEMKQYLKEKCDEFYQTQNFEYCRPTFKVKPEWKNVYNSLESRNIWQIPDQSELEVEIASDSTTWIMEVQVRLDNYYRSYTHTSPDQYTGLASTIDIKGVVSQLQILNSSLINSDNFNVYRGVTNGSLNSPFLLCGEKETWRFNGVLEELASESGIPTLIESSEDSYYLVTVSGTVEDEWYGNRDNSGFMRVINPSELNQISILSSFKCPSK